jgi:hypothetical protein
MKKVTLCFLLGFISFVAGAQNYRCVQNGLRHYFTNSSTYLRGIRIDSVRTYPDSTVYFPFRTQRGPYLGSGTGIFPVDMNGGCWLGKRITELADGTALFENIWQDSVVIKTQAGLGDTWIFYQDTSNVYYQAEITSLSTQVIYGTTDSVKTISIKAFDRDTGFVPSDPVNGLQIILSKNYGFYSVFDIYLFPHRFVYPSLGGASSTVFDYFFRHCGSQQFQLTEICNPRKDEVFDFNVNDIFEYEEYCGSSSCKHFTIDTYFLKETISTTQIKYTIHRRERTYDLSTPYIPPTTSYTIITNTINKDPNYFIDTAIMPEETGIGSRIYYAPVDSFKCYVSCKFSYSSALFNDFEPCGDYVSLKQGMGVIEKSHCADPSGPGNTYSHMIYAYKNGIECGTFVSVADIKASVKNVAISPNPANSEVTVNIDDQINHTLQLHNILGQVVFYAETTEKSFTFDVSKIHSGLYYLSVLDMSGNSMTQKLLIAH